MLTRHSNEGIIKSPSPIPIPRQPSPMFHHTYTYRLLKVCVGPTGLVDVQNQTIYDSTLEVLTSSFFNFRDPSGNLGFWCSPPSQFQTQSACEIVIRSEIPLGRACSVPCCWRIRSALVPFYGSMARPYTVVAKT